MNKEYKISQKRIKAQHLLSYRCPYCRKFMELTIFKTNENSDVWNCDNCKKSFELAFRELIPKPKKQQGEKK